MKSCLYLSTLFARLVVGQRPWSDSGSAPWNGSNPHWPHPSNSPGCAANNLEVRAPSGTYRGLVNATTPQVRQFLGIPFASPPTGNLRFMPPQSLDSNTSTVYDASHFPPSCPQYVTPVPNIFNQVVPEFLINSNSISEDCLALSVWTPAEAQKLPVIMFITGGGFFTGGVDINYQLPHRWVQRTQAHIVVTINYRVNLFGFPNAEGLDDQNLGILDQRMALEWVRDNIEAFGGDPSKITMWGQSAGGSSVDYHNFAYYQDPIVTGFFAMSGSTGLGINVPEGDYSNFTTVAKAVNCTSSDPNTRLDCMRQVPWQDIMSIVGPGQDTLTLGFYPVPDDKIVFSNYTQRYIEGKLSRRPAIFSTCLNEGAVVVPFNAAGVDSSQEDVYTRSLFLCPATEATRRRTEGGFKTYRALYAGNFSNVSPLPWMGAYHDSDLPPLFGTYQDYRGPATPFQTEVSATMQDFLLAFMQDANQGLERLGWPDATSGDMVVFARGEQVVQTVSLESVQGVCEGSDRLSKRHHSALGAWR